MERNAQMSNERPVFILDNDPEVDWPVVVVVPGDGGVMVEQEFIGRFKVLSQAAFDTLRGEIEPDDATAGVPERLAEDAERFARVMVDWKGPKTRAGEPVLFSQTELAARLAGPQGLALSQGIWRALAQIRWGAAAKN